MKQEEQQRSDKGAPEENDLSNGAAMVAALNHAQEGRPVFPCRQNKTPYTRNGFKDATTDKDQISTWWSQYPDAMIGMPTGEASGIDVLDIDVKGGKSGEESLAALLDEHGKLPDTTQSRTASGGRHFWFRHTAGSRNTASKVGADIDTRGEGGYVILPDSVARNGKYEWIERVEKLPPMPSWLLDLASEKNPKHSDKVNTNPLEPKRITDDDVIPQGQRNDVLTREAGKMRRIGMSVEEVSAALQVANSNRCKPPLPESEVSSIAHSVGRYEPELDDGQAETPPFPTWAELAIDAQEAANASLTPTCVVDHYLYADVAQLVAPGGTGKTTLMLWEAVHIALGRELWGLEVKTPGKVLIITAEDERERLVARLWRIVQAMGLLAEDTAGVFSSIAIHDVAGTGIKLTRFNGGNIELTSFADNIVNAMKDDPPVLVVFDPLVSFGASEQAVNDNEQHLILAARRIVKGLRCCVRLVHHTGK